MYPDERLEREFIDETNRTASDDYSRFHGEEEKGNPYDNAIDDIDFSLLSGQDFKHTFNKASAHVNSKTRRKKAKKAKVKPLNNHLGVSESVMVHGGDKKLARVLVPRDRKVIIESVSDFILDDRQSIAKSIGYHEGRELKCMTITMNNDSAVDFNLQLFNPSMPLAYLYSTSQNLNDKITVGGGEIAYSDLLFNILANPMFIYQAKFTFSGPTVSDQLSQSLQFINKNSSAYLKIDPVNVALQQDPYQFLKDIVFFEIKDVLNRPFVPDGMDVIQYKVLAHMQVTMAFFYDQLQIKRIMYEQAAKSRNLL